MNNKLLISVLGNCNAGKSSTWKQLFGRQVRTSSTGNSKRLTFDDGKYIDVVVINGSPQERGKEIEDVLKNKLPYIVLCSVQYTIRAIENYKYFFDEGYHMYVQWLNPGYNDHSKYEDIKGIASYVLNNSGELHEQDGQSNIDLRVEELKTYLYNWGKQHGYLKSSY